MKYFSSVEKIGDIVARFPKASDVFKRYNIDFCCGGNRTLIEAINEQRLSEEKILGELNSLYEEYINQEDRDVDWTKASWSELIDHVVNTHHAYLNSELPKLSQLVTKILRAHGVNHGEVLTRVHKLFHSLKADLEQHLIKEEEILFPMIKKYEESGEIELKEKIIKFMDETEDEHDGAGNIIKELRRITDGFTVPADGCTTFRLTYDKLKELESDLFQHIHLENNILFPSVREK